VGVEHAKGNLRGGPGDEQEIDIAAEPQILSSLPYVETQSGLSLAGVARVELQEPILQLEAGEARAHGLLVEHLEIEKAPVHQTLRRAGQPARIGAVDR